MICALYADKSNDEYQYLASISPPSFVSTFFYTLKCILSLAQMTINFKKFKNVE